MNAQFKKGVLEMVVLLSLARKDMYGYEIVSEADAGVIHASVTLDGEQFDKPATVTLRIPHPQGKKAVRVTQGEYCPETETVTLTGFNGTVTLDVFF